MLVVLLAWIAITLIFLSLGNAVVCAYNSFCKRNESYNLCDVFIIGMCFVCGILAITSIYIPVNNVVMFALVALCALYWSVNRKQLNEYFIKLKQYLKSAGRYQILLMLVAFFALLLCCSWTIIGHDAAMYHFQLVRWNEEYPLVAGLANIEERFGFNSNYFLVSALFTFRFMLAEAFYPVQSLLALFILGWIISAVFRAKYSFKSILLLCFYVVFLYINNLDLRVTSSDIVPNLIGFYLFARIILEGDLLKRNYLFFLFVPVALVTFKLSGGLLCLMGLYPLILIFKNKQYKVLSFIVLASLFVLAPWLFRNVVISGYLIYPLGLLDLFSFDWKVPLDILEKEVHYINTNSKLILYTLLKAPTRLDLAFKYHLIRYIHIALLGLILLSPVIVSTSIFVKRMKQRPIIYGIYTVLIINLVFWYISAADPRFVSGLLLITSFLTVGILFSAFELKIRTRKLFAVLTGVLVFYLLFDSVKWIKVYHTDSQSVIQSIYKPRFASSFYGVIEDYPNFTIYRLNNSVSVFVTDDPAGKCYDKIPSVKEQDYKEDNYQDYKNLEARGNSIRDGFRYRNKTEQR